MLVVLLQRQRALEHEIPDVPEPEARVAVRTPRDTASLRPHLLQTRQTSAYQRLADAFPLAWVSVRTTIFGFT